MAECQECGHDPELEQKAILNIRLRTAAAVRMGLEPTISDEEIEQHEKGKRLKAAGVQSKLMRRTEMEKDFGLDEARIKSFRERNFVPESPYSDFNSEELKYLSWFDVFCAELSAGIKPTECDYYEGGYRRWNNLPETALEAATDGFRAFKTKAEASA